MGLFWFDRARHSPRGDAAQPIKCLLNLRLAEIAEPGTPGQDPFAQLINGLTEVAVGT